MATAPDAIFKVFGRVQQYINRAELGGIVGDVNHSFGYHLARNELPSTDYSVILPLDQQGDPGAASALDISLAPDLMIQVTNRLLDAAKAKDPRLKGLREFCGTTNGTDTHPYDLSNGQDGPLNSWDASHLWHVHLSFYRAYSNNFDVIGSIADVITGQPVEAPAGGGTPLEDTLSAAEVADIKAYIDKAMADLKSFVYYGDGSTVPDAANTHPYNLSRIGKNLLLAMYGDGPNVTPGADTHPNNLKVINSKLGA